MMNFSNLPTITFLKSSQRSRLGLPLILKEGHYVVAFQL